MHSNSQIHFPGQCAAHRGSRLKHNRLVTPPSSAISAATFDTRVDKPRMPGSAAKAAKKELRELGFIIANKPESFRVHGYEGPLLDGERDRAERWGRDLGTIVAGR